MKVSTKNKKTLVPPDRNKCQALKPNKTWSPFNLGPADINLETGEKSGGSVYKDRYYECKEKPVCIVTEREPINGQKGSMSLCKDCFVILCLQNPEKAVVTEILDTEYKHIIK